MGMSHLSQCKARRRCNLPGLSRLTCYFWKPFSLAVLKLWKPNLKVLLPCQSCKALLFQNTSLFTQVQFLMFVQVAFSAFTTCEWFLTQ